jgi:protein gp37
MYQHVQNAGRIKLLNKQGPGKIDYCDYTWNPVSGCLHNCDYCYLRRFNERFGVSFEPKFHPDRLNDPATAKKPSIIFVGSSGDMFGEWVPSNWIYSVLKEIEKYPQHIFLMLTKNPKRYSEFKFPKNCWLGTTVDGTDRTIFNMELLIKVEHTNLKFISFEPLLSIDLLKGIPLWAYSKFGWFIVGADSNPGATHPPLIWADKFRKLCTELKIPLWIKDNFSFIIKIKEAPKWNTE